MSLWQDALRHAPGALDDFKAMIERRAAQAAADQDKATESGDYQKALAAYERKKFLATLLADLLRSDQEESKYAEFQASQQQRS